MSLAQMPDELRTLLSLTKRCARLDTAAARQAAKLTSERPSAAPPPSSREAMAAAAVMQMQAGDLLLAEPGDTVASALWATALGETSDAERSELLPSGLGRTQSRLLLATAMAAALKGTGTDRLALVFARAGTQEHAWSAALAWAQTRALPLVLVCGDPRGANAFRASHRTPDAAFGWDGVASTAHRLKLPILSVDGEDAVAMYRVVEEAMLRARAGRGPTLIWAMLPSPRDLAAGRPATVSPVARLQRYLRSRKISLR